MKKEFEWNIKRHLVLSFAITGLAFLSEVIVDAISAAGLLVGHVDSFGGNQAASIGIIGGADGPTAIFVTGPSVFSLINRYVVLLFILLLLYLPVKAYVKKAMCVKNVESQEK